MGQVSDQFYLDLRTELGITKISSINWVILCKAWQTAEGGAATHNPFNCIVKMPGSTTYNSVGVQNYSDRADGIAATKSMLKQSNMASILKAMQNGSDLYYIAAKIGQSPWGTDLELLVKVLADNFNYGA